MNRNVFKKIIEWDKNFDGKPLIITGAPGTGKTYLSLELAKNFHDSYLYLNPQNDYKLRQALLESNICNADTFISFLYSYYQIPAEWLSEFLIIIDDFAQYNKIATMIDNITDIPLAVRLLIITTAVPTTHMQQKGIVIKISPLEFDEYLKAIGSEWYTEIIRAHYQTKKKIPEIVHKEMLNLFRDYLRIGGMPAAINEYLHTENLLNVSSVHRNLYEVYLSQFKQYEDSSIIRFNQLMSQLAVQLSKENKNYRYNLIRKGATHAMYRKELQTLTELHLVNKLERADIIQNNHTIDLTSHDNQFRLYPNDSGLLYTLLVSSCNYTDETEEEYMDASTQRLYQLLLETYLLQTLSTRKIQTVFWESGSLSKIDFIASFDNCIIPIEAKFHENKRTKSMHVFFQKFPVENCIKFGLHNFEHNGQTIHCPIYSMFCL